jgi:hypothetical protein
VARLKRRDARHFRRAGDAPARRIPAPRCRAGATRGDALHDHDDDIMRHDATRIALHARIVARVSCETV